MKYCFGVDINCFITVKMGLFKENGDIAEKWEIVTRTEDEGKAILPDIAAAIEEKIKTCKISGEDVLGVGVGVPAPVTEAGVVNGSANLGWKYKEVKRELEELTGFSVQVGNDANVAALGEMWKGGGAGQKNMIMVTLGTGVGGGVIIGGKVIIGEHGAGGEIGHLCVNYEETENCGCGNRGCLEQYASATGIVRIAKKKLVSETRPTVLCAETVTAKDVFDAVKEGDPVAQEIAEEFGSYLGYALANLAAVADPSVFVIGGGVSKAGEILIPYIQNHIGNELFFANKDVEFKLATLANDAGICGAAKLLLDAVEKNRTENILRHKKRQMRKLTDSHLPFFLCCYFMSSGVCGSLSALRCSWRNNRFDRSGAAGVITGVVAGIITGIVAAGVIAGVIP